MNLSTKLSAVLRTLLSAALLSVPPAIAIAQAYPSKPIRLIVPFPPGGGTDLVGRAVGTRVSALLGQQVIVENRAGAGGMIGVDAASKAAPDGYTMLIAGVGEISMFPSLYRKLPYDPLKDLQAVSLIAITPQVLVVNHALLPVSNVRELLANARTNPSKLNYGTFGPGSLTHVMMELLASQAGIKLTAIPYKGSAPALTDLLGGQIGLMLLSPALAKSPVDAGKLRAIGVTARERLAAMPEVPTIHEAGVAGYDAASWFGAFVPMGASRDIVAALNKAVVAAVQTPEVSKNLLGSGILPRISATPEDFTQFVRAEIDKWGGVINGMGLKLD